MEGQKVETTEYKRKSPFIPVSLTFTHPTSGVKERERDYLMRDVDSNGLGFTFMDIEGLEGFNLFEEDVDEIINSETGEIYFSNGHS